MTVWIIEPHDPLIVRDGRPFGPDPDARAISLPFPFPSTTTGGVRTRAGQHKGIFELEDREKRQTQITNLKEISVRGPFLVQLTPDNSSIEINKMLVPAPRDALLFAPQASTHKEMALIQHLVPLHLSEGAKTDFDQKDLLLVGQPSSNYDERKPLEIAPNFWYWDTFIHWLLNPTYYSGKEMALSTIGIRGLQSQQRTHVSIDAKKEVARDGMLFQTSGLEFTLPGNSEHRLSDARQLALAVAVEARHDFSLHPGIASFGGERRIVMWRESRIDLPSCPETLEQTIVTNKACRILLLTPACFEQGYIPTWLYEEAVRANVRLELQAIAIQRPQVVSGWDLDLKKPKTSRRLAPAGTVLFLSLQGSDKAIKGWIRSVWMQCISDDEQDRKDGFGVVVVGTWFDNHNDVKGKQE